MSNNLETFLSFSPESNRELPELFIRLGITRSQIKELVKYSINDPLIGEQTKRDRIRFADSERAIEYLSKRSVYTLCPEKGKLAGLIWFSRSDWDVQDETYSPTHTYAIRLYGEYRGKGLASQFSELTIDHFIANNQEVQGIWLKTNADNVSAQSLYAKTGWTYIETQPAFGTTLDRVVMYYPAE